MKLLGHTQLKTTQRYSHLSPQTLLDATDAAANAAGLSTGLNTNLNMSAVAG